MRYFMKNGVKPRITFTARVKFLRNGNRCEIPLNAWNYDSRCSSRSARQKCFVYRCQDGARRHRGLKSYCTAA
ncbi:hypothetical protein PUN28_018501 [Cardiocondyla obscurior]|uniref:Uncharacterized protein n=1 Tax=Cardiocondyla obscurior TaxID=286306 RepID=A0AAW2EF31_9HYME